MFESIREDIRCVFERDPAARNILEVLTTYSGVHALMVHRCSHFLWRHRLKWLARFVSAVARLLTGVEIHPAARIGRRFFIDHGMGVVIGETAEIGDDCTLYHGVTLGGTSWAKGKRHPTLKNNVIIGTGAKVLGPIIVGEGARIGSNAVVVKDVPNGATVVGVPGHIVPKVKAAAEQRRQEIARKIGFDAYGGSSDMPDPVAHAVNCLLDHIHAMDGKMEQMRKEFNKIGVEIDATPLSSLDLYEIDSVENNDKKEENSKEIERQEDGSNQGGK